jgi:hypothetical protein
MRRGPPPLATAHPVRASSTGLKFLRTRHMSPRYPPLRA